MANKVVSSALALARFVGFSMFQRILIWVFRIQWFYSSFLSLLQSKHDFVIEKSKGSKVLAEMTNQNHECSGRWLYFQEETDDGKLCRGEVETVMENLGIFIKKDEEKLQEKLGLEELSALFEEEPSIEEVKEAFEVFDENKDGFIDARELQRVLCGLGFVEGSKMQDCRWMIRAFDMNGDGKIDFGEFVKFMENSF
ncbi:probable calcium-binding protein CML45 [Macadamia integrifolia]|uniref:probable calcium-binding protein CML45 n=1 Tax=Macadamia integrifolia TaxID=60698 RepID=UPI001C4EC019|nr:probable calcium-binding protein CML45 [Macadamia integrifolia]